VNCMTCSGRCRCHRQAWDALDAAAGIRHVGLGVGRPPYERDAEAFQRKLDQHYRDEQDAEPDRKPSLVRVAERFGWERRTLRKTINRLGARWPPDPGCPRQSLYRFRGLAA